MKVKCDLNCGTCAGGCHELPEYCAGFDCGKCCPGELIKPECLIEYEKEAVSEKGD
jgi:hypothetical protein